MALAYYYQMDEGWYEENPWVLNETEESYEQLKLIDTEKLSVEASEVLNKLIKIFENAVNTGCNIIIEYD